MKQLIAMDGRYGTNDLNEQEKLISKMPRYIYSFLKTKNPEAYYNLVWIASEQRWPHLYRRQL